VAPLTPPHIKLPAPDLFRSIGGTEGVVRRRSGLKLLGEGMGLESLDHCARCLYSYTYDLTFSSLQSKPFQSTKLALNLPEKAPQTLHKQHSNQQQRKCTSHPSSSPSSSPSPTQQTQRKPSPFFPPPIPPPPPSITHPLLTTPQHNQSRNHQDRKDHLERQSNRDTQGRRASRACRRDGRYGCWCSWGCGDVVDIHCSKGVDGGE
jgi:hypothetical protein